MNITMLLKNGKQITGSIYDYYYLSEYYHLVLYNHNPFRMNRFIINKNDVKGVYLNAWF